MNDLAECDSLTPCVPSPAEEFTSINDLNTAIIYQGKNNSARAQLSTEGTTSKRNLCIVSSQNSKNFPKDFFSINEYSGYFTQRNGDSSFKKIPTAGSCFKMEKNMNFHCEGINGMPNKSHPQYNTTSPKDNAVVIDLQKEIDEDREILEMIKESTGENKQNTKISFRSFSDNNIAPLPGKFHGLKPSTFEMIPEEDEEKTRIENETSKRFFKSKELKEDGINELRNQMAGSINIIPEKPMCNNGNEVMNTFRRLKIEINDTQKEENDMKSHKVSSNSVLPQSRIFSPNLKVTVVDQLNEITRTNSDKTNCKAITSIRKNSRERSIESPSTCEFTHDSAKNKRRDKSPLDEKEEGFKIETFLKDSFKLKNNHNYYSAFTKMPAKSAVNHDEDVTQFSAQLNEHYLETNVDPVQRKSIMPCAKISIQRNLFSNPKITITNPNFRAEKIKGKGKSEYQPERIFNQLPPVKSESQNMIYSNLARIVEKANNYKEDPVIRKKLDNLLQNISDINVVLSQKSKTRMKVASAPSYCEERTSEDLPVYGNVKKIIKFIDKKERKPVKLMKK